jgi:hypothetical protein
VGGGGTLTGGNLTQSVPAVNGNMALPGQTPNGWRIMWSGNNAGTAFAVCAN